MEPRNTNAPSLRGPVLMAYGRSKKEKLRLCCGQHVYLNDCNSNVVKMFESMHILIRIYCSRSGFYSSSFKAREMCSQISGIKWKFGSPTIRPICNGLGFLLLQL